MHSRLTFSKKIIPLRLILNGTMLDFLKFKKKNKSESKKKKSFFRELFDDILFALVAVTIIRGLFIEAYAIPTGSMENSMMIGDHLFVSKVHFGPRSPRTLIQFPLAHQDFWGTGIPSYSDAIQLPTFRFPGLRKPKSWRTSGIQLAT